MGSIWTIADGEFVALLGSSGCGKTTTLRMICGLEVPTGGTIYIGDREVTNLSPRDRDVAMVFQDYALYPHMTIDENIGYPLKVRGVAMTNAPPASAKSRAICKSANCWRGVPVSFPAGSSSARRWRGRSSIRRRSSCSTNR